MHQPVRAGIVLTDSPGPVLVPIWLITVHNPIPGVRSLLTFGGIRHIYTYAYTYLRQNTRTYKIQNK